MTALVCIIAFFAFGAAVSAFFPGAFGHDPHEDERDPAAGLRSEGEKAGECAGESVSERD